MFDRREAWLAQQEQGKALYHEWHHAVTNRLTSEEAYARFEEIHAHYLKNARVPPALDVGVNRFLSAEGFR